jgi:peptidoglycan/xylan/chitin deacetylase (PgdA/CDA1 family)
VLKRIKLLALSAGARLGLSRVVFESEWRRQRLLILCYHGISIEDEHEWDPALFMPAGQLRERFAHLRAARCNVLPFDEAFRKLSTGDLPPRAVTVTFDDGTYDFLLRAMPILREYGIPATLYFATYYSYFNRPIYDLAVSYVLWKARGREIRLPELQALQPSIVLDDAGRAVATRALRHHAHAGNLTAEQKDELLARVAAAVDVDLDHIRGKRILHLMTPDEAASVAREGVDIQLHTHRHRVYDERSRFDGGVDDNRRGLASIRPGIPDHFCYPGGVYLPEFPRWLEAKGVRSATTCDSGLATRSDSPWLLPRVIDTTGLTLAEFSGWVTGLASFLPRRPHTLPDWMLVRGPG